MASPGLAQKAAESQGLPVGFKTYSPFPFGGMNQQAAEHAIADNEFTWQENFVKLGDGNLRTLWDHGQAIYTAPGTLQIVYYVFYTRGLRYFCAVFLDNGSAVQIDMFDLSTSSIGSGFYTIQTGFLPYGKQWGSTYLLICNHNTKNDYWVWDGTLLYVAGSLAPQGVNILSEGFGYSTIPTVAAYGGSGSGMTFDTIISQGGVSQIHITNPGGGFNPGDVVQLQFTGGGSDDSAVLSSVLTAATLGGVAVLAPGSGYTTAAVNFSGGGGGSGAAATATITNGQIADITVTNAGSGYTTAPAAVITGDGTGAVLYCVLSATGVASVTVDAAGSGFTSVPLITFRGGGGSGAVGQVLLTGTTVDRIDLTSGGSGYGSAPTIAFVGGGGGSGAAATANMIGDVVGSVTITNPGSGYDAPIEATFSGGGGSGAGGRVFYAPTSIASVVVSATGQYYVSAPAVLVTPGANNSAYATIDVMPYGVSGSAMETFLSRVWIIDPADSPNQQTPAGNLYQFTAPGSVIDFATSDGGGAAQNTDAFLNTRYVNLRQSAGYLYLYGDGSVSVISNVTTSGQPISTTYNYQNVDPQAGLFWRDSIQDFGRSTIIGNETGIYGLYGGAVTNISLKIQQLFNRLVLPNNGGVTPSSATATIFNVKHSVNLVTLIDPDTNLNRNVMLAWNEKDWTVYSQSVTTKIIATRKVGSTYSCWGSDGRSIYPFFTNPSTQIQKRLDTKVYGADRMFMQKEALATWLVGQSHTPNVPVSAALGMVISGIGPLVASGHPVPFDNPGQNRVAVTFSTQPSFSSPEPYWNLFGAGMGGQAFVQMQVRLVSTAADFTLGNFLIGYKETLAYYGQ